MSPQFLSVDSLMKVRLTCWTHYFSGVSPLNEIPKSSQIPRLFTSVVITLSGVETRKQPLGNAEKQNRAMESFRLISAGA